MYSRVTLISKKLEFPKAGATTPNSKTGFRFSLSQKKDKLLAVHFQYRGFYHFQGGSSGINYFETPYKFSAQNATKEIRKQF